MTKDGEAYQIASSFPGLKGGEEESNLIAYCNSLYGPVVEDLFKRLSLYENIVYQYYFWWQIYESQSGKSMHGSHNHFADDGVVFSFVHFIKTNNEPRFAFCGADGEAASGINEKDGDLIFFHPLLMHQALTPTAGNRAVIAGNVKISNHFGFTIGNRIKN